MNSTWDARSQAFGTSPDGVIERLWSTASWFVPRLGPRSCLDRPSLRI